MASRQEVTVVRRTTDLEANKFFESGVYRSPEYMIAHTRLPENPELIPKMIVLAGPARSGTTAFGLVMAGHPLVGRSYFQPWKAMLRWGDKHGDFVLRPEDEFVFAKETFGPYNEEENMDPIGMLLAAGVPAEKITGIILLRDPVPTVASLNHFITEGMDLDFFAEMQRHTIALYEHYQAQGVKMIPFVYDLFELGTEKVMRRLVEKMGLGENGVSLRFNQEVLDQKMVWGEANEPNYWEGAIWPTLRHGEFKYIGNTKGDGRVAPKLVAAVRQRCQADFEAFRELAVQALGL